MILLKCDLETISTIFYNFLIPISIIVGGIWTLRIFSKRKEDASLLLKIDKIIQHYSPSDEKYYLNVTIVINNNGKRDLDLLYQKAIIRISKVIDNKLNTIPNIMGGLTSHEPKYNGRLRSNVQINLPYFLELDGPGLYFIEFSIDVDMKKYYYGYFKKEKDKGVKQWSDRIFFKVEKTYS